MAILKVDTITSDTLPTVSITDGASISGVTTFSSNIIANSNIGIGSDSPSKKLHVHSGTSNNVAEFESSDTGAKITLRDPTTASSIQQFGGEFIIDADSDDAGSSSKLLLRVDGSEKLRINSDGEATMTSAATRTFLAVNTTNNSTRGLVSIAGKDGSGNAVTLKMGGFGDTSRGEIFTHSNHDLGFATNNAATQMKLTTSGDVGITTAAPAGKLHLYDAASDGLIVQSPSGLGYVWAIQSNDNLANGTLAGELGIRGTNGVAISGNNGSACQVHINSNGLCLGGTGSANGMDDYEEGSFTAAAYEGGSAITLNYHNTHGRYTKVGNMVTVWMWVRASGTTTSTGGMQIGGLPFASNANSYRPALVGRAYGLQNFSSKSGVCFWMNGSESVINVVSIDSNGLAESSNTSNNVWQSGAEVHCTFSYFV